MRLDRVPSETERPTLALVASRSGRVTGRVERRLLRVGAALVERGWDVTLICPPRSPMEEEAEAEGIKMAPVSLDRSTLLRSRSAVVKYLVRARPDIIHSAGYEADMLARAAAPQVGSSIVNTLSCARWPRKGGLAGGVLRRAADVRTLDAVDAFVCDCKAMLPKLEQAGVGRDRIMIDPPTVDVEAVLAQAEESVDLSSVHGPMVGYGGRIEESRGLHELVAASAMLDARGALATCVIAGDGPLLKQLKADQRSSRVRYLGWVESIPAVIKRFEIAVFPSTGAGVPTSLLEAAVLARPIVATRVEGVDELFDEGDEICLVEPGDARALAGAIADLTRERDEAARMGEAARTRAISEYSSIASIDRHADLYEQLKQRR